MSIQSLGGGELELYGSDAVWLKESVVWQGRNCDYLVIFKIEEGVQPVVLPLWGRICSAETNARSNPRTNQGGPIISRNASPRGRVGEQSLGKHGGFYSSQNQGHKRGKIGPVQDRIPIRGGLQEHIRSQCLDYEWKNRAGESSAGSIWLRENPNAYQRDYPKTNRGRVCNVCEWAWYHS